MGYDREVWCSGNAADIYTYLDILGSNLGWDTYPDRFFCGLC